MFLYKYGAFLVWTLIVIIGFTCNMWTTISTIIICCVIGITYADFYTKRVQNEQQKHYLLENDVSMLVLAGAIFTQNLIIIGIIAILLWSYHVVRHNNMQKIRKMKSRVKYRVKNKTNRIKNNKKSK